MPSVPRLHSERHREKQYLPYAYAFIAELCRQQAEVIQNHGNEHVRNIGQGKARHRKYNRLKLGGGEAYDRLLSSRCSIRYMTQQDAWNEIYKIHKFDVICFANPGLQSFSKACHICDTYTRERPSILI
jgi:hypothetical protein